MRLYNTTVVFAVVFIILIVIYFAFPLAPNDSFVGNDKSISEAERVVLVPAGKDKFAEINRTIGNQSIIVSKKEDAFVASSSTHTDENKSYVNELIDSLSFLTSTKIVNVEPLNYNDYGLDEPVAVINVRMQDGSSVDLYIGNQTYSAENYYVKRGDENPVYCISTYTAQALLKDVFAD